MYREEGRRFIDKWAGRHFYIPETSKPIQLLPHQIAVLRYIFRRDSQGRFPFNTVVFAQPKKSGKTAISGLVGRWAAETWGRYGEVLYVGNDADQARERGFAAHKESIELDPLYDRKREVLPGQWLLQQTRARCLSTGTHVKAIATDYQGEAGANPIITVWTELWGFIQKASLRFWAEMGPSPTRPNSMRWVETYAGYEGESELLEGLYTAGVKDGRQLTADELGSRQAFEEAPNGDSLVPCWINEAGHLFVYWDSGEQARRMPWQQGESGEAYYASEAMVQTEMQFRRLHLNEWISAESEFVPIEWWDACLKPAPLQLGDKMPLVMSLDAAVSGDCFGLALVSRDPASHDDKVLLRLTKKWTPPSGGKIDYAGPEAAVRQLCAAHNVVQVAYDPYQLHDFATRLQKEGVAWFRPFNQGEERLKADKLFYDVIRDRRIGHDGSIDVREHLQNANKKQSANEDTKLRLVKKSESRKIDLAVCVSMATAECLRLML